MPKLIARWNRARDAWETETTGLFCEHSDVYSETWPSSGMTRNGVAYELPTSAPLTDGSEYSSLLPTPTTQDGANTAGDSQMQRNSLPLNAFVRLLPTPRATDGTKGGSSGDLMLPSAVQHLLPTPRVLDSTGVRGRTPNRTDEDNARAGLTLTDVTEHLLPTPRAAADRTGRSAAVRRDSMSGPSLGQAVEIAQGILPREFTTWEELPPSWHGASTSQQYDAGND